MRLIPFLLVTCAIAGSGCLGSDEAAPARSGPLQIPGSTLESLGSGTDCIEGSAILAYPGERSFRSFVYEDIRADFPDGRVTTLGQPVMGPTWGSYVSVS